MVFALRTQVFLIDFGNSTQMPSTAASEACALELAQLADLFARPSGDSDQTMV